jgi:sialic acid synthase SpsE
MSTTIAARSTDGFIEIFAGPGSTYSKHTKPEVPFAPCTVGKYVALQRSDGGPDAAFSLEADELASVVRAVREANDLLGYVRFAPTHIEHASIAFRRSLRAVRPIAAGTVIGVDDGRSVRPAGGLHPDDLHLVFGQKASRDLEPGDPITWSALIAGDDV